MPDERFDSVAAAVIAMQAQGQNVRVRTHRGGGKTAAQDVAAEGAERDGENVVRVACLDENGEPEEWQELPEVSEAWVAVVPAGNEETLVVMRRYVAAAIGDAQRYAPMTSASWRRLSGLRRQHATSVDSFTHTFELEKTERCWKDKNGHECGGEPDPESETGLCAEHRKELRDRWT